MATSRYFRPVRGKSAADSGDASPRQPEQNASQMSATLLTVASDVLKIKQTTAELKNNVDTMQVRLTKAEGRISDIEETTQQLVTDRELHSKWIDTLWTRVEDLENRSRCNNVRLLCLTEGKEGTNLKECIAKILSEGLGMDVGSEFKMERPHRSPGSWPKTINCRD